MSLDTSKEKITEQLPRCSESKIKFIWNVLYEDWEDCPEEKEEAIELIEEEMSCLEESIKINRIYKKIFNEEAEED